MIAVKPSPSVRTTAQLPEKDGGHSPAGKSRQQPTKRLPAVMSAAAAAAVAATGAAVEAGTGSQSAAHSAGNSEHATAVSFAAVAGTPAELSVTSPGGVLQYSVKPAIYDIGADLDTQVLKNFQEQNSIPTSGTTQDPSSAALAMAAPAQQVTSVLPDCKDWGEYNK